MIDRLYDLSVVVDEAYPDTYILARSAEFAKIKDELDKPDEPVNEPEPETRDDECIGIQEPAAETAPEEEVVVVVQEETGENQGEEEINNDEQAEIQPGAEETRPEPKIEIKNKQNIKMEKRFSLLNAINSVLTNRPLDEISQEVCNQGISEMRSAGLSYTGQFQLPAELRSVSVTGEGEDIVGLDLFNILTPLRERSVLA